MSSIRPNSTDDWLDSGVVPLTGAPDGPPMIPPGAAASYARSLSGHISDATVDTPFHVDVDGAALLGERASFTSRTRNGAISVGRSCRLLPSSDGWIAVSCAREDDASLLSALISQQATDNIWPELTHWIAQHTDSEFDYRAMLLGIAGGSVPSVRTQPTLPGPLVPRSVHGMLVVDFSALWAGPLCAQLLGAAGARVVKVETPTRLDGARYGDREFYRLLHAGHESVVLDPGTETGRVALRKLVDAADIVIEASRPRALRNFGLDAESSVASGSTWISITANGRASDRVGFGDDIAASSGLVARHSDGSPLFVGDAIADPLTGLTAAAVAMSQPSGSTGKLWDLSMSDIVACTLDGSPSHQYLESIVPSKPHGRAPQGEAPISGADTSYVLRSLGIELP